MQIRYTLYSIFALIIFVTVRGQSTLVAVDSFQLKADKFVGIDKFQNLYYLKDNILFKKPQNQTRIAFQDILLGDLTRVDFLNPNKVILFYQSANTAVILDNRMTEIDRQDFNTVSPFKNVAFAGTSKDQSLWIYNIDLNQLELYDYRYNKTLAKSLPIGDDIVDMVNNFNLCYLLSKDGVLIFNIYGSLVNEIRLSNIKTVKLYKNQLLILTDKTLMILDKNFQTLHSIETNSLELKNLFFAGENLYIYDGKNIVKHTILSK